MGHDHLEPPPGRLLVLKGHNPSHASRHTLPPAYRRTDPGYPGLLLRRQPYCRADRLRPRHRPVAGDALPLRGNPAGARRPGAVAQGIAEDAPPDLGLAADAGPADCRAEFLHLLGGGADSGGAGVAGGQPRADPAGAADLGPRRAATDSPRGLADGADSARPGVCARPAAAAVRSGRDRSTLDRRGAVRPDRRSGFPGAVRSMLTMLVVFAASALAGAGGLLPGGMDLPSATAGWLALGCLVLLYGVAFSALFILVTRLDIARNAPVMNIEPVAGLLFGWLILGQLLNGLQIFGGVLVVSGIVLLAYKRQA